jgi:hypothetical protein
VAPSSVRTVKYAQGPEVLFTVDTHVITLGEVHEVNLHLEPATKPSGSSGVFVTNTGSGVAVPIWAVDWAWLRCVCEIRPSRSKANRASRHFRFWG